MLGSSKLDDRKAMKKMWIKKPYNEIPLNGTYHLCNCKIGLKKFQKWGLKGML